MDIIGKNVRQFGEVDGWPFERNARGQSQG